ncbi:MAG: NAD(P)-binding protein [Oscillospiraceae bacterium]|nr:NAD(P)-binding protein [Oscillospiraceae bacterium]
MIIVSDIRLPLESGEEEAKEIARQKLGDPENGSYQIRKKSYDLRRGNPSQICSVVVKLDDEEQEKRLAEGKKNVVFAERKRFAPKIGLEPLKHRPVVVGSGPAGLFAAYLLAQYGYRPILLERGADVDSRVQAVDAFFESGNLNKDTNIQFGEGGAGTFSDGKLVSRIHDDLCEYVLNTFYRYGAPEDILVKAKPHIGTDELRGVIKRMRQAIETNGGEVHFFCRLDDLLVNQGKVVGVRSSMGDIATDTVILAVGHSARDTFEMLSQKGLMITSKPFSVGLRIEHLQKDVNASLYGKHAEDPRLPVGEYNLSTRAGGRGVYTFCMCPGGQVVPAASESGGTVTNGMSNHARNGKNANSAVCVSVLEKDFGHNPYRAMEFQRNMERAAYAAVGGEYRAPASNVSSFLEGRKGLKIGRVEPTYARGVVAYDLWRILGEEYSRAIRDGLLEFGRKMKCFADGEAILTGVETRTSSPLRICRTEEREAIGLQGLYPCGEGAGFAGGIMSAAVDGLRTAAAVIEKYRPE